MPTTSDPLRKVVFYSWQSDLPDLSNRQLIRAQLRVAVSKVEEKNPGLLFEIDEATRGLPGSPHIPTAITDKIRASDFFVCDVSTINSDDGVESRRFPNPNVVFELGYAVATLGWGRIVMLVNTQYGGMSNLPFDFDRHRATPYKATDPPSKSDKGALGAVLSAALAEMAKSNPDRPGKEMSPAEKKRARDITNLTDVLSTLHIPTIDEHLESAPHMLTDRMLDFWERFNAAFSSNLFDLYDEEMKTLLTEFHSALQETIRHGELYHPNSGHNAYIFTNPGDLPLSGRKESIWDEMQAAVLELHHLFPALLSRVRQEYTEIDVQETSRAAWKRYVQEQKELLARED